MANLKDYRELKNLLISANEAYYKKSEPIMSDFEFDKQLKELEKMEKELKIQDSDSPTLKPGSDLTKDIDFSNRHKRPMLSLENTYNQEDVSKWYGDMEKEVANPVIIIDRKYDGGSAAIRFKDGKVIKALSRGNGTIGEDFTRNVQLLNWDNIDKSFSGEVRGELIISKEGFNELNKDCKYQNARNLLSGSMKLLDPEEFKERAPYIKFYAYWFEESGYNTYKEDLDALKKAGFTVGSYSEAKSLNDVLKYLETYEELKDQFDVDIDGAVMKLNDKRIWNKLGSTAKFPRWAKAYKFIQSNVKSIVNNITFEVGRTGKITPLVWFEPKLLDGSTIQKATLNNKDFYEAMNIGIGDTITVQKAAAIIPQVIDVQHSNEREVVPFPERCPCCGSKLRKHNEEHADMFCDNLECSARTIDSIVNYTHLLEIDGFAEIIVERLHKAGLLSSIKDLYNLKNHIPEIGKLDRLSENIAKKLVNNIETGKSAEFWKLLAALGIPNVGPKTAKTLANKFKDIDSLMKNLVNLESVDDIAEITADGIREWFSKKKNIDLIDFLKSEGQNMTSENIKTTMNLSGKSFCITGALSKPRTDFIKLIEDAGGKVVSGVSSKTDYLITNDKTTGTSKNIKAKELNIPIINEEEFLKMIKETK